jgi:class 3 adenylate cyclase
VTDRCDARALVDVEADVSLRGQPRLTRVEPHPHPDRAACQRALSILGGCDGIRRPTEGGEERVTLGIHLDPVVRGEGGAQNAAMLVQGPGVALAELLEQPRRALHVGEEQRDHARGTIAGHPQRS